VADRATRGAAGGRHRRALAALVGLLLAHPSRAGDLATIPGAAAAFETIDEVAADSLALRAQSIEATQITAPAPFTLRRIVNPNYRPPTATAPPIVSGASGGPRALDRFSAQISHQTLGLGSDAMQWQMEGSEQYRNDDALGMALAGERRFGASSLRALRIAGRRQSFEGSLVDAEPISLWRGQSFDHLRGGVLRFTDPREGRWLALGGVPTPIPGTPTPRQALGGAAAENVRYDEAEISASAFGFWRGVPASALVQSLGSDTLPGRGAVGTLGWRAPVAGGRLSGRLGAQLHSLDGPRALAGQNALEWTYQTPGLVAALSDERATSHARVLGTERFAAAARREDRWNLQSRFLSGRSEAHFTGVIREGGDSLLVARTVQLGASGNLGRSPWYGGADAVWDRRAIGLTEEQRFALYAGGALAHGHALLGRLELNARSEREIVTATAEASLVLARGARLGLEPRLGWDAGQFRQGELTTRYSVPCGWLGTRVTASLTAGALRDDGFRGAVREAALSMSLVPRLRDRADLEVRRTDQDGRPVMSYDLSYDAEVARYETPGTGWFAGRDTGRVVVHVVRNGNAAGMSDVLISIDGKDLGFTDADGVVRFDHVAPGIHLIAVEERSLPANVEVVQASRVFVTVEPGRVPDPVWFTVGRSERRSKF
jgi:hypothetical protein